MTAIPAISILLTSYNHQKYLRQAIDSVINQTFSDFELIIADDNSDDGSWDIIKSYSDPRIIAIRSHTNSLGFAFTKLNTLRGKYYAILHSDDWWEQTKLERQYAFMESNPDIGATFTSVNIVNEQGVLLPTGSHPFTTIFKEENRTRAEWLRFFFEGNNTLCHPSVLVRMSELSAVDFYRYGLFQLVDLDLWIRLCLRKPIHIIGEKLINFRVRDDSKNTSAPTAAAFARASTELFFLLENYTKLDDVDVVFDMFPEFKARWPGRRGDAGVDVPFMLAMAAIEPRMHAGVQLFGLKTLMNLLNDESSRIVLADSFEFTSKDFVKIYEKADPFSTKLRLESDNNKSEKSLTASVDNEELLRRLGTVEAHISKISSIISDGGTDSHRLAEQFRDFKKKTRDKLRQMRSSLREVRSQQRRPDRSALPGGSDVERKSRGPVFRYARIK